MNSDPLSSASQRLAEEQRRLALLRSDYETIIGSRFHALRMFWFSLKALLGFGGNDRYAVWARIAPSLPGEPPPRAITSDSQSRVESLSSAEEQLLRSWPDRAVNAAIEPIVSVVVPVFNQCDVTVRCLQSIVDRWPLDVAIQVIVVDDASSDQTPSILTKLAGLDYVRNANNSGFVRSCNRGAALARGKYILFLNNDTEVREGWVSRLVSLADTDATVGAVGSKLVYPDGTLQEAGGIIFRDASGWNYGRKGDPSDSRYNYVREVDYCSGAALMVRSDLFRRIGGFDELFAPAYYEDVDLCFSIRSLGHRVLYQPLSEVVHYEGITSGTDVSSGTKRYQEINRPKFQDKWSVELQNHFAPDPASVAGAAHRLQPGPTILIVDSYVPLHDQDAGSLRLLKIIQMLREAHYRVIFLPDNYAPLQPYTMQLQTLGVEVLHHTERGPTQKKALEAVIPSLDFAWICRPDLFAKYATTIRRNRATRILYDTIDLHFVRKRREFELFGGDATDWQTSERQELAAARSADATIVVTEDERNVLVDAGVEVVFVVPTLHDPEAIQMKAFEERSGVLFIGGYNHTPNVDAAKWLVEQIMPLVWREQPEIIVTLLGSNPPESVQALQSANVRVPGFVSDVSDCFESSRIFVAPIRFGAGMKGKVGHALSYGLPTILTTVAAEGFGLTDDRNCLIADDAERFARAILRAYCERDVWNGLSESAVAAIEPFTMVAVKPQLLRAITSSQPLVATTGAQSVSHTPERHSP